jgi:hypothetical protein
VNRTIIRETVLLATACADGEIVRELSPGEPFLMLDDSLGWAWGYAAADMRVGYVASDAVGG